MQTGFGNKPNPIGGKTGTQAREQHGGHRAHCPRSQHWPHSDCLLVEAAGLSLWLLEPFDHPGFDSHSHVSLVKSLNFSAPTSQGPRANLTNLKCRQQSQAAAAVTSLALGPQKWLLWVCSQNPYECWDWGPMITKVGMQIGTPYLGAP